MSENGSECRRFEDRLTAGEAVHPPPPEHLAACPRCRAQWAGHRLLAAAFAGEPVPVPGAGFERRLEARLAGAAEAARRPLSGWRRAAMWAYGLAATGLLAELLRRYPPPAVDLGSPWLTAALLAAVPLTLALAAVVARLLPARGPEDLLGAGRGLALGL